MKLIRYYIFLLTALVPALDLRAQQDTIPQNRVDSLLSNQKGILGDIAQSLIMDTAEEKEQDLQRGDKIFQRYRNKVIRKINVQSLRFGVSIGDTSKKLNNRITRTASTLHRTTRPFVIKNQLFFREYDRLSPFLFANNERYLRDLPFLQDARIIITPVRGRGDSVDVTILIKDVLSIGGGISIRSYQSAIVEVKEDNFLGYGDRLQFQSLYDRQRNLPFGYGLSYLKRNILGTFIDANVGYLNFNRAFNSGRREENVAFIQLVRPLINPNAKWTYAFNAELHSTSNMFNPDSVYENDWKYRYRVYDSWVGWNPSYKLRGRPNEARAFRYLIALRMMDQNFLKKPLIYKDQYHYGYSNLFAFLGSVSVYRQLFYKTSYIYGFGRKEDLPQGIDATLTTGLTKRDSITRPYIGFNVNLNYVTTTDRFFNYTVAMGTSLNKGKTQDMTLMASVDYFGRLHHWKRSWKQRTALSLNAAHQLRPVLDEPLFLESQLGLPGYDNQWLPGHSRITLKAESIFYMAKPLFYFKIAPFLFGSSTLFKGIENGNSIIPIVGGGIRIRNESLIFGTIELRGSYFLKKDFVNSRTLIQLRSNLRYKYTQNFIRRPELIRVN